MAKEKNKTKLQGYMLSPYYGTEPPPETNIRYSRPPKEKYDAATMLQSMDWASEYENLTEFTDEQDPRKGEVKLGEDNPRFMQNQQGDAPVYRGLGYINPYTDLSPQARTKLRIGETFHNLQNVAPNAYNEIFQASLGNPVRMEYLKGTYENKVKEGEERDFEDWYRDNWFVQDVGGYLINATTPELNPTGEWSQDDSTRFPSEFRKALDKFGKELGLEKHVQKSLGKTDVQSTNQDRDIAPLARAVIPAKERVPEGSWLDKNPLAMEIYLDTVTPLRRGENTEKITRETYFNFPSATKKQLDLQGKAMYDNLYRLALDGTAYLDPDSGKLRSHIDRQDRWTSNPKSDDGKWAVAAHSSGEIGEGDNDLYEVLGEYSIFGKADGTIRAIDYWDAEPGAGYLGGLTERGLFRRNPDTNKLEVNRSNIKEYLKAAGVRNLMVEYSRKEGDSWLDIVKAVNPRDMAERFMAFRMADRPVHRNIHTGEQRRDLDISRGAFGFFDNKSSSQTYSQGTEADWEVDKNYKVQSRDIDIEFEIGQWATEEQWAELKTMLENNYGNKPPKKLKNQEEGQSLGTTTVTAKKTPQ